jgi:ABC-type dipeptide/oligopeptide/nickel transport system permease subunit
MLIGGTIVLLVIVLAIAAPLIAPQNPYVGRTIDRLIASEWMDGGDPRFLLGTDGLGRDALSRLVFGARVSIAVAILAVIGASSIGVLLGLLGAGDTRLILRHILPNVANLLVVIMSLQVAQMIILESFLSFLGLGVQPPIPSWGSMLGDGRLYMFDKWWMATIPGLAIFVTTLAINLVGDGLRDLLDPYSRTNI